MSIDFIFLERFVVGSNEHKCGAEALLLLTFEKYICCLSSVIDRHLC